MAVQTRELLLVFLIIFYCFLRPPTTLNTGRNGSVDEALHNGQRSLRIVIRYQTKNATFLVCAAISVLQFNAS